MTTESTQSTAAWRQRLRDSGLVRFETYCTPEEKEILKSLVASFKAAKKVQPKG